MEILFLQPPLLAEEKHHRLNELTVKKLLVLLTLFRYQYISGFILLKFLDTNQTVHSINRRVINLHSKK